ncbi:nucleotidyltransferase [Deinococcus multiflagellatus]|uniref:Nucleotidyltransferase n=1 Tax=Deinococcus multiflagellatus TaxID=1656887 RepID=A0ABW1ZK08_9DEIO|nr:nucleotidyltransferase [Deinococcus multiflagellatus]MBZ9713385.1 nucleotidyltransferase [Deinococcus multiflagellatus]
MELPLDFRELLSLLNAHGVEYVLVGGYAVGVHGFPRYTGDLDLFYGRGAENARRLAAALAEFGLNVTPEKLDQENVMFRMGVKPVMVEFMSEITGVPFAQAWANRVAWTLDDLSIPLISLADLRRNKQASGRHKDLADLEELPET